jgi:preprotein translocase subunit SecG
LVYVLAVVAVVALALSVVSLLKRRGSEDVPVSGGGQGAPAASPAPLSG